MDFIAEDGYEIKAGMEEAYQRWLMDHQAELRRSMPAGTEYLGTYVLAMGNGYEGGHWRDLVRLDSYGALDRLAAANQDADSEFGRLGREGLRFLDLDKSSERWTHVLLKNALDATIIDSPSAEAPALAGAGR
jgi:hypothetical protein